MAVSKVSSLFLSFSAAKLNPPVFARNSFSPLQRPFSTTATPYPLYYELIRYRPARASPSRGRLPNAHDGSDKPPLASSNATEVPSDTAGSSSEAAMDRSKRRYYRKRQRRMYGGFDDEDGRRGAGDEFVELQPEVIDFPRLHPREEELFFYDAFAYPWEKDKHYRMLYQLEKKYFPQYSLEKAFVDPSEPVPPVSAEEGTVKKKGRKPKKGEDGSEGKDERALIFFEESEEKKESPAIKSVTEKKVEEFFKCLRKVPKASNRQGVVAAPITVEQAEPYLVSRKTELPPRWDGPSGTVVLVDKPKGLVATF